MIVPDLIAITDSTLSDDVLAQRAEQVLAGAPPCSVGLQLRDRSRAGRALFTLARRLKLVCERHRAPLYLNDRVDIALAAGADGVHLGSGSVEVSEARSLLGADAFVSLAAHQIEDVERARAGGATAVLLAPIFLTPGKGPPRGTEFILQARQRAPGLALFALGGIDHSRTTACGRAGADGVAAIRAVWHAGDPGASAHSMVFAIRASRTSR